MRYFVWKPNIVVPIRLRIGGGGSVGASSFRTFNSAVRILVKAERAVEKSIWGVMFAFLWDE